MAVTSPPPGRALHLRVGKLLLGVHELFLHLLRGGEQLLHIQLAARFHVALIRW